MLKRTIGIALPLVLLAFMTCSKEKDGLLRDNPADSGGVNWCPPEVAAMGDTTVTIGDSFFIHAKGSDRNGTVAEYWWALDGIAYKDVTDTGRIRAAFMTGGARIVRVKVVDNDGIESKADSIRISVKGNAPINLSPANGVSLQTARPTLRWMRGRYNNSFTVLLDTANPPVAVVKTGGADSFFTPATDLKCGKTWFWQVAGLNALGQSDSGEVWQFNTPLAPGTRLIAAAGRSFSMGQSGVATPVHTVYFTYDFYMDSSEVTQAEFRRVMGVNPSGFSYTGDTTRPVEQVTWFDAALYCNRRSRMEGKDTVYAYLGITGTPGNGCTSFSGLIINMNRNGYRLPTEAEWEYACRAGSATPYWWGNDTNGMGARAWSDYNSFDNTHRVMTKLANPWGLYDMIGNVSEWCQDGYASYGSTAQTDPTGPASGFSSRVLRGGSYSDRTFSCFSSAYRTSYSPGSRSSSFGFRTVARISGSMPVILTQPQSDTVAEGESVSFSVWADGVPSPAYQWKKNGVNISGAVYANYTIAPVQASDSGKYTVVVSNSRGSDTSDTAVLTVIKSGAAPVITTHPKDQAVLVGQTATFTVAAAGTDLEYQWQKNTFDIPGATSTSYTTPAAALSDSGATFRCVVMKGMDKIVSNPATLTVTQSVVLPVITAHPQGLFVSVGRTATFTVSATGIGLQYQWLKNGSNITGADSASYTTPAAALSDNGSTYRCMIWNSAGPVMSNSATLTVSSSVVRPSITADPQSQTVSVAQTATFRVTATGTDLLYQWQRDLADIPGATASSYTTPAVVLADDSARFRCVVSNSLGSAASAWATLTVEINLPNDMVPVPAGSFQMGSTIAPDEQPIHTVYLSAFSMGATEVTQGEYLRVMGVNPSSFTADTNLPVENLTWFDAVLYCNRRSRMEMLDTVYSYSGITGTPGNGCTGLAGLAFDMSTNGYRLPTEAEWEYACRAGETGDYYWGGNYPPASVPETLAVGDNAWWMNNSTGESHPVAGKAPNIFGLYDMAGNVGEWCHDLYGGYPSGQQIDPTGATGATNRVVRGGYYDVGIIGLRSAVRVSMPPIRIGWLGFRVVSRL